MVIPDVEALVALWPINLLFNEFSIYSTRHHSCRDADHVVIPDVEALVALLEVWELPATSNFLLLSSVLRQV